jgi:hypothetical protein
LRVIAIIANHGMTVIDSSGDSNYVLFNAFSLDITLKDLDNNKSVHRINLRIFTHAENDVLASVRFQISKDEDLDFLYDVTYNPTSFHDMRARQHIDLNFADFPNVICHHIQNAISEMDLPQTERTLKMFLASSPASDRFYFHIYQKLPFCRVELFKLEFVALPGDRIISIAQARYQELAERLKDLDAELKNLFERAQRTAPSAVKGFKINLVDGE